jgi:hypothetical protein
MGEGYGSRKFLITMAAMVLATGLAAFENLDANGALVFAAGIGAYNWSNLRQSQNGSTWK